MSDCSCNRMTDGQGGCAHMGPARDGGLVKRRGEKQGAARAHFLCRVTRAPKVEGSPGTAAQQAGGWGGGAPRSVAARQPAAAPAPLCSVFAANIRRSSQTQPPPLHMAAGDRDTARLCTHTR